ncbi:MAG: hypothetical protein QXU59_06440 [Pyrobaculum sp.]
MIDIDILGDNLTIYYKGRKIPTVPLYVTTTLSYTQFIVPYVAKRLIDLNIYKFKKQDPVTTRLIELACKKRCIGDDEGVDIGPIIEEAYYNYLTDRVLASTLTLDAIVVPCADIHFAKALVKRAREYTPDILLIASKYGGECPDVDYIHEASPIDIPLPLGPISRSALNTAIWSIDEKIAESPLTPLLDACVHQCEVKKSL